MAVARSHVHRTRLAALFVLPAMLVACTGGGGSYDGSYQSTQDAPSLSNENTGRTEEGAGRSNEAVPSTNEGASVSGGTGAGLDCSGTYSCVASAGGQTSDRPQTLRFRGTCIAGDSGFNSDGTLTDDGKVVGSWRVTSNGFSISTSTTSEGRTVEVQLDCTKIEGGGATGDDDDDDDDDDRATPG